MIGRVVKSCSKILTLLYENEEKRSVLAAKKPGGVGSSDGTVRVSKPIHNGSKWCFLMLCNDDAFPRHTNVSS